MAPLGHAPLVGGVLRRAPLPSSDEIVTIITSWPGPAAPRRVGPARRAGLGWNVPDGRLRAVPLSRI